jgi:hypothetical protein
MKKMPRIRRNKQWTEGSAGSNAVVDEHLAQTYQRQGLVAFRV